MSRLSRYIKLGVVGAFAFAFAVAPLASAASEVIVTPSNTQGWSTAATTSGGTVTYADDASGLGEAALRLTTDGTTASRAQYMHAAAVPLSEVNDLSYQTKRVAGPDIAAASYQLPVYLNGTSGFTTMVYEPSQNGTVGDGWQTWNVAEGQFWSTRSVTCSNGGVQAGGGGTYFYTLEQLKTMCPDATVLGYGVNIGTNNLNYDVRVDAVTFNITTYNFEQDPPADEVAPTTPTNLRWENPTVACGGTTSSYTIIAAWGAATDNVGVVSYNYKVMTPAGTDFENGWMTNVTGTSRGGEFNRGEGTYTFMVQAVDAAGNVSEWSAPCVITYDKTPEPAVKEDCKNGNFRNLFTADDKTFKNQGQCVAYGQSSENSAHHRVSAPAASTQKLRF